MRYARTIVRDHALAKVFVQETLTRGSDRPTSFCGASSLPTWLHRIRHNLAADHVRRDREIPAQDVTSLVEER